jgi:hypothetical protein
MKIYQKSLSVLALMLLTASNGFSTLKAYAQEASTIVDLAELDCRTLLKMDNDEEELTLVFYHGLITGKNGEMSIDTKVLKETTDKVIDYCIDNPNDTLMSVFEQYRAK